MDSIEGRYSVINIEQIEGREVAIKTFKQDTVDAIREIDLHRILSENVPGVVTFLEARENPKRLVLEYCARGSLRKYYSQLHEHVPEEKLLEFFREMIETVERIHNLRYVHRALTADNWLVTADEYIKLTDFGHTTNIPPGSSLSNYSLDPANGSTNMIFVNDVTILGNVFLQMATGNFELQRETLTPETFEQRYSTSLYSSKVKTIVKSLLFYNRGGRQVEVRESLLDVLGSAVMDDLENIEIVYPKTCTNCTRSDETVVQLPCAHFLCAICRRNPESVGEMHCEFCKIERTTDTLSFGEGNQVEEAKIFSKLFS